MCSCRPFTVTVIAALQEGTQPSPKKQTNKQTIQPVLFFSRTVTLPVFISH